MDRKDTASKGPRRLIRLPEGPVVVHELTHAVGHEPTGRSGTGARAVMGQAGQEDEVGGDGAVLVESLDKSVKPRELEGDVMTFAGLGEAMEQLLEEEAAELGAEEQVAYLDRTIHLDLDGLRPRAKPR